MSRRAVAEALPVVRSEVAPEGRVLMITYVFPPSPWVGGHRTLKYCKYLGGHGWRPIVLTARPAPTAPRDEKLLAQVPADVRVHRTLDIDPAKWEEALARWKHRRGRSVGAAAVSPPPQVGARRAAPRWGLWTRIKDLIKSLLKESPDSHIFWVPFAFLRGVWILLRERIDVIYCTSPPHSSHLAAFLLARCFRKPYVMDFRDPWYVLGSAKNPGSKVPWLLRLETRTKAAIVRNAARIICVSRGERDELCEEFPDIDPRRVTFITNGYDASDFEGVEPERDDTNKLVLIHAGTIYPEVAGEFFEALRRLHAEDPAIAAGLEVRLLGEIAYEYTATVQELEALGLVRVYGMQPHRRTVSMMLGSDVLVILMGGSKYRPSHLPSKGFEYLYAGKPILAIAREGELADMMRRSGLGIVASPDSVDGIVQALRELYRDYAAGRLQRTPDRAYIESFDRKALAAKLASVLDEVRLEAQGQPLRQES